MTTTDKEQIEPNDSNEPEPKKPKSKSSSLRKRDVDANYLRNKSLIAETLNAHGINKRQDFIKYEVKPVGDDKFRVNVVCATLKPTDFLATFSRPLSYYVSVTAGGEIVCQPQVQGD
jgi:hypothetical protein